MAALHLLLSLAVAAVDIEPPTMPRSFTANVVTTDSDGTTELIVGVAACAWRGGGPPALAPSLLRRAAPVAVCHARR